MGGTMVTEGVNSMTANVTVIPPRAVRPNTLRVAAYCRVSSDSADQLHSYAAQIRYYTDLIQNHEGWEMVDVYAEKSVIVGIKSRGLLRHKALLV